MELTFKTKDIIWIAGCAPDMMRARTIVQMEDAVQANPNLEAEHTIETTPQEIRDVYYRMSYLAEGTGSSANKSLEAILLPQLINPDPECVELVQALQLIDAEHSATKAGIVNEGKKLLNYSEPQPNL